MTSYRLRPAAAGDAGFLTDMLVAAVNWAPTRDLPRGRILADPALAHYVAGWPRPGDRGVVAVTPAGTPAGACWLRVFAADDPGYGYVAADVPELSMGVAPEHRRRGVGRRLLRAVLADARAVGLSAVSLSVERANGATALYAAEGFRTVASHDAADTMLATLAGPPGRPSGRPDG